jgi:hypothetical protein
MPDYRILLMSNIHLTFNHFPSSLFVTHSRSAPKRSRSHLPVPIQIHNEHFWIISPNPQSISIFFFFFNFPHFLTSTFSPFLTSAPNTSPFQLSQDFSQSRANNQPIHLIPINLLHLKHTQSTHLPPPSSRCHFSLTLLTKSSPPQLFQSK